MQEKEFAEARRKTGEDGLEKCLCHELLNHLEQLHTTELGILRIKRNLSLDTDDVVGWCKMKTCSPDAVIKRRGKNWYVTIEGCIITINAYSYTIITAHMEKVKDKRLRNSKENILPGSMAITGRVD